jgi:hypothetical protein
MLSALESTDPSTVVAEPSKPLEGKEEGEANGDVGKDDKESEKPVAVKATASQKGQEEDTGVIENDFTETDDINDIPESRTFLARVSYKGMAIHWLQIADYEGPELAASFGIPDALRQNAAMDPAQAQYYAQTMGYPLPQQVSKGQQAYYYQAPRVGQQQFAAQQWPGQFQHLVASPGMAVTAGEAAAQQQKQNQGGAEGDPNGQGQWQVVYPGQEYGYIPQEQLEQGPQENAQENDEEGGPAPVDAEGEEPDAKRFRSV